MSEDVFSLIIKKLEDAKGPVTKSLVTGQADGERGYGLLVGQIIGLDTAIRKVVELRENLKESEDA